MFPVQVDTFALVVPGIGEASPAAVTLDLHPTLMRRALPVTSRSTRRGQLLNLQ